MTFATLITILTKQLRAWINDNLCSLTINCDTGQHSQFLQCFWINCQAMSEMHELSDDFKINVNMSATFCRQSVLRGMKKEEGGQTKHTLCKGRQV